MKLLYIFADQTSSTGVIDKVKDKINTLNKIGVDCKGIFFRYVETPGLENNPYIRKVLLERAPVSSLYNRRFFRLFKGIQSRKLQNKVLIDTISREIQKEEFDLILFRYPLASPELAEFTARYRKRFVFEHNGNELFLITQGYEGKKSLYARFCVKLETEYGPLCTSNALGLIGVGHEVVAFQKQRSGLPDENCECLSNGIPVEELPLRKAPDYDGKHLNILFLTGSPRPVDGVDLIFDALSKYKGTVDIRINVAGPKSDLYEELVRKYNVGNKVFFAGNLQREQLNEVFDACHIAFGTMALHRMGLKEQSALKVLEYVARGIPFAISYIDTNLIDTPELNPYIAQLPGEGQPVNMETVVEFADRVLRDKNHSQSMRKVARERMDVEVKMKQLKAFLERISR